MVVGRRVGGMVVRRRGRRAVIVGCCVGEGAEELEVGRVIT
jgi:hypothetical protein